MRWVFGVSVSLVIGGNLVACGATTPPPQPSRQAALEATGATPVPVQDAPADLPDRFEFSTHDPIWSVRVEAMARVVLEGPGGRQRVLRVERHDVVFDGRYVQARDEEGAVEIRVTPRLCQDRASTLLHPYTARLTIEGTAPLLGCGRPLP